MKPNESKIAEFDLEDEIGLIIRKYKDLNTATAASSEFARGFAKAKELYEQQIAELKRETAFKIWQRHWGRVFMKDDGSDYDESPDSQDCKDVFEEIYEASKKGGQDGN